MYIHGFASIAAPADPTARPGPPLDDGAVAAGRWVDEIPNPGQLGRRRLRFARLDRMTQLCLVAAHRALSGDARLGEAAADGGDRLGIALGTAQGAHLTNELYYRDLLRNGAEKASPALFTFTLPSVCTGQAAIALQLRGPVLTLAGGPTSGLAALDAAAGAVSRGDADEMLAGAVDTLGPTLLAAVSGDTDEGPREGAAFFVVSAQAKGATAKVVGRGMARGPQARPRAVNQACQRLSGDVCIVTAPEGPLSVDPLLALDRHLASHRPLPLVVVAGDPQCGVMALALDRP